MRIMDSMFYVLFCCNASPSCEIIVFYDVIQGNAFWRLVRNVLKTPGQEQIDCQFPKPILLDTGEMKTPYDWAVSHNLV